VVEGVVELFFPGRRGFVTIGKAIPMVFPE